MAEYTTELDVNGATIDRAYGKQITSFKIVPGHCIANKNDVLSSRTIESYDKNVLAPLIASGEIGDGTGDSWDDRKVRYDKLELDSSGEARIFMGNSYFQEPGRLDNAWRVSEEEGNELTQMGIEHFNDPYAFFPRKPGVTGIIRTLDAKLIIGDRVKGGQLQVAAGFMPATYRDDVTSLDLHREMEERVRLETKVTNDLINGMEFLGLYSDPSANGDDLDFTFLIDVEKEASYFTGGEWKEDVEVRDHNEFYAIHNFGELQKLVNDYEFNDKKWEIIFSTRGPLAALTPEDFE